MSIDTIINKARQTGRTTRMIEHAKELSAMGRAVYIVAANEEHKSQLERVIEIRVHGPHGIKVETWHSLRHYLDAERMVLHAAHPNCIVLADHFAIESRFHTLLEMLHLYDKPETDHE